MHEPRFEQILGVRFFNGSGTVALEFISCNGGFKLVSTINRRNTPHLIIGISGGVQEKLGFYLRENLAYRPAVHCIGAALGFLTGDQKPIPGWADRFYLGWFLRLIRQPKLFAKRFLRAFELPWLILKYGEKLPPLKRGRRSKVGGQ